MRGKKEEEGKNEGKEAKEKGGKRHIRNICGEGGTLEDEEEDSIVNYTAAQICIF